MLTSKQFHKRYKNFGSGSGTRASKFLNNGGKATFSGDGYTTAFNIAHNLASSPNVNRVQATAANTASNGNFDVLGNASNVIIAYQNAPASGTNNLQIFWFAAAG